MLCLGCDAQSEAGEGCDAFGIGKERSLSHSVVNGSAVKES